MKNILKIEKLKYKNLFDELDLNIERNTFSILSGPNNSGKTTLLRLLNREIETNESITIDNMNLNDIEEATFKEYIQIIIPNENIYYSETLDEEIKKYIDIGNDKQKKEVDYIIKELKAKKILTKKFNNMTMDEIIISQLILAIIDKPKILLIDNIKNYFENTKYIELLDKLKLFKDKYELTILLITNDLEDSISMDKLYIVNNGKIELEGSPLELLEKDNVLNKIGLNIPFMIDLSVKLRDYDLIDKIELDYDRMVDILWK